MATAALPLAEHCQFKSASFEAMHHRLNTLLKPHRLRRLSRTPVSGIICRATLHRVSINLMRIGPAVDVWPGTLEHFYLVQIPIHGAVEISHGEDRVRCAGAVAAVISPAERLRARWSDNCTQLIVQIPRETIEGRLVAQFGRNPQTAAQIPHGVRPRRGGSARMAAAPRFRGAKRRRRRSVFPRSAARRA